MHQVTKWCAPWSHQKKFLMLISKMKGGVSMPVAKKKVAKKKVAKKPVAKKKVAKK